MAPYYKVWKTIIIYFKYWNYKVQILKIYKTEEKYTSFKVTILI